MFYSHLSIGSDLNDGSMSHVEATCRVCKKTTPFHINVDDLTRWIEGGELIQSVFPNFTPDERELLISGTCGPCFEEMFK